MQLADWIKHHKIVRVDTIRSRVSLCKESIVTTHATKRDMDLWRMISHITCKVTHVIPSRWHNVIVTQHSNMSHHTTECSRLVTVIITVGQLRLWSVCECCSPLFLRRTVKKRVHYVWVFTCTISSASESSLASTVACAGSKHKHTLLHYTPIWHNWSAVYKGINYCILQTKNLNPSNSFVH